VDSDCPFYPREWHVVQLLAEGSTPGEIGLLLDITASTVRKLLAAARARIDARTDEHLVAECYEQGWLKTREHQAEIEEWPKITPGQRLYLDAFDRFLLAGRTVDRVVARAEMRHHLKSMCIEKGDGMPDSIHSRLALAA